MAETMRSPEANGDHIADTHLKQRRNKQDSRLRRWGTWFAGGIAAELAGWGFVALSAPWVGIPLIVGGVIAETVGTIGVVGNIIKGGIRRK